ncbi:hypothetical protein [Bordetella avium]|nr:hypothetical protein [Bordetella avium]
MLEIEVAVKQKHQVVALQVQAEVRYWEGATVNGQEDIDGSLIPLRVGNCWAPTIELETGKIRNWPAGTAAEIYYKVCDQGEYWLVNEAGERIAKWASHYVPDELLCVGDQGHGDYIILKVAGDGHIQGWTTPILDPDEWRYTQSCSPTPTLNACIAGI